MEETRYMRLRTTKRSCTLTAPAGAREGRHEGQLCSPGLPHLLPALYPPHCFTSLLLFYLLTSDCWILSISLNANLPRHPSPLHFSPHILCSFGRCLFVNTIFLPLPLCKHPSYTQEGAFLFPANKWRKTGAAPLISITASEMYCFPLESPLFPSFFDLPPH